MTKRLPNYEEALLGKLPCDSYHVEDGLLPGLTGDISRICRLRGL
jgi:hypothetical protein